MPKMDGIQAAARIRALETEYDLPRCRIIVLTGLSYDTSHADGVFDHWIVKGGKSLALIMAEIVACQGEIDLKLNEVAQQGLQC